MILHYTNRFKLILDIIFKPKDVIDSIILDKQESIDNLKEDFQERLNLIEFDQFKNGIIAGQVNRNKIAITKIPTVYTKVVKASIEYRDVHQIFEVGYISEKFTIEELKTEMSKIISRKLIDKGFIQTIVNGNEVKFYINAYEK